jgi:hypothetical protein
VAGAGRTSLNGGGEGRVPAVGTVTFGSQVEPSVGGVRMVVMTSSRFFVSVVALFGLL